MKTDTPVAPDIAPPPNQPDPGFEAIKAEVEAALRQRSTAAVTVEVTGADVTLSGRVESRSERDLAGLSAWGTPGVRKVINRISVDARSPPNNSTKESPP